MKPLIVTEHAGSFGAVIAAMGCASCFPALGSIAAALGLGFLAEFEGLFINTLLPVFAAIALVAALINWWQHCSHVRGALSVAGPAMVLATLYPFWAYNWSTYMFYAALALMLCVGIWDFLSPPKRHCGARA